MPGGITDGVEYCGSVDMGTSGTTGTTVTPNSGTWVKGAWAQLIAATLYDFTRMTFSVGCADIKSFDFGIGPAGQEKVIVNNMLTLFGGVAPQQIYTIHLPLSIPAGTRISARCAGQSASAAGQAQVTGYLGSITDQDSFGGVDNLGYTGSGNGATAVTPNATANTKGSWAVMSAATTRDYAGFFLLPNYQTGTNGGRTMMFDVGVGPSGQEKVIQSNAWACTWEDHGNCIPSPFHPVYCPIQAGSRVAVRAACSGASGAAFSTSVLAFYK